MAKPLSMDLRERAVSRVESGHSVRTVAEQFGVSPSSVVKWSQRFRRTGSVAPGKMGGHRRPKIAGLWRDWLVDRMRTAQFTLRGLVSELADRGLTVDYHTVWNFVHQQGLSYKKDRPCGRAAKAGRGKTAGVVEEVSRSPRPQAACLHRRDVDEDQHGADPRMGSERSEASRSGSSWPLEDHDISCRSQGRSPRCALRLRWSDQW